MTDSSTVQQAVPVLLTQLQIEDRMYDGGIARATANMANTEQRGAAYDNPYAKEIIRDYVLPIAAAIEADINASVPGQRGAHVGLILGLDIEAVAFLAVRHALGVLLGPNPEGHNTLGYGIGRTVNRELVLSQFEMQNPALYHTLSRDFSRRMSKDERHRVTVFKMQAAANGIKITEWPVGAYNQVGLYLMGVMERAGLLTVEKTEIRQGYIKLQRPVYLNPEIMERIDQVKAYVAITAPVYGPCVEPPRDWAYQVQGGFHSPRLAMRNALVHAVAAARDLVRDTDMPIVYKAVNALQRTAWKINTKVLDTVYDVSRSFHTKEIVSLADSPKPVSPAWLTKEMKKENFTDPQMVEFLAWKRSVTDWHTERKIIASKYARFYSATRAAEFFRDYPKIYFVYFADSRGRLYPMTQGISPQGSDLGKALLHFAEGHAIPEPEQVLWFKVQGANKWGFDKATLQERASWVDDRALQILSFAVDPLNNTGWKEAGDPLQFLAWCFEYREWMDNPSTFKSHLPISMDGSCNGLQNLSAMFRDPVGGKATNLTANEVMEDIYKRVAEAAEVRLASMLFVTPEEQAAQDKWVAHGISRSAVKRAVMTTPYGVTLRTATQYIIDDYLREGSGPTFDKQQYRIAANVIMKAVWPAIGDVVVKGREAMDWLKKSARVIINALPPGAEPMINWYTPSGFPACQAYFEHKTHQIKTHLHGPAKIKVLSETDEPNKTQHASGLAPNFVHSMDAAHLHLTTAAAWDAGIEDLAMIHDDYGCHAAFAPKLFNSIREEFVRMYTEHDTVASFSAKYNLTGAPTKGTLDIQEVLKSQYFFS